MVQLCSPQVFQRPENGFLDSMTAVGRFIYPCVACSRAIALVCCYGYVVFYLYFIAIPDTFGHQN